MGPPLFEIAGFGGALLWTQVVLTVVGLAFAIRGYWGGDPRSRRLLVLVGLLTLGTALLFGGYGLLSGFQQLARLGPAATMADLAKVLRRALSPSLVGVAGCTLMATVAAAGWVAHPEPVDANEPPRRPVR